MDLLLGRRSPACHAVALAKAETAQGHLPSTFNISYQRLIGRGEGEQGLSRSGEQAFPVGFSLVSGTKIPYQLSKVMK